MSVSMLPHPGRRGLTRTLSQGEGLPWQVNKIIGYLQVFPENSCFLSLSSSCFEIFPHFGRQDEQDDKVEGVYIKQQHPQIADAV